MAFEPINTDEKLEQPVAKERDTDTVMLIGCSGFVAAALLTYGLSLWPFFVYAEVHLSANLATACALGLLPALVFGGYVTRRHGLPAACGFVGGGLATAIFLFLRLTEVQLRRGSRDMEPPDYPSSWVWMLPLLWIIVIFAVAMLLIRRSEVDISSSMKPEA
jgi:hypothetical protein